MQVGDHTDILIAGAGQSGLSVSYFLKNHNIPHFVLEQDVIGASWQSQRWDSFKMNSPNQLNLLPGDSINGEHPEAFWTAHEFATRLNLYVTHHGLPVIEKTKVLSAEKSPDDPAFIVTVEENNHVKKIKARQLVVASGAQNHPKIPSHSNKVPSHIFQIHSSAYRNPTQLPKGATLVVGSATSGVQITEELLDAGRKVYLVTSPVGRIPRRYRGRDIMAWLAELQIFDKPASMAQPHELKMPAPLLSGIGEFGHTVSLQSLHKKGATIMGYLRDVDENKLEFEPNAADHIRFGDTFSTQFKSAVDQYVQSVGLPAAPPDNDEADTPDDDVLSATGQSQLSWSDHTITSIIWATGYGANYEWLKLPAFDPDGKPIHTDGKSIIPGLYFMGLHWQRKLKSSLIYGVCEDAEAIAQAILQHHDS